MEQNKKIHEAHQKITLLDFRKFDEEHGHLLLKHGLSHRKTVLHALTENAVKYKEEYYCSLTFYDLEAIAVLPYTACGSLLKNLSRQGFITLLGHLMSQTKYFKLNFITNGMLDKYLHAPDNKHALLLDALENGIKDEWL